MFRPQQIQVPVGPYQLGDVPTQRRETPIIYQPSVPVTRDLLGNDTLPTIATPLPGETPAPPMSVPYVDALSGLQQIQPAGPDIAPADASATAQPTPSPADAMAAHVQAQQQAQLMLQQQRALWASRARARAQEAYRDTLTAVGVGVAAFVFVCALLYWTRKA